MRLNTDTITNILPYISNFQDFLNLSGINEESFRRYKKYSETFHKNLYNHKFRLLFDYHYVCWFTRFATKTTKTTNGGLSIPFSIDCYEANGVTLPFSEAYKRCRPYLLRASLHDGFCVSIYEHFKDDRDFILKVVRWNNPRALRYASRALRNDREIVMLAVKDCGNLIEFASDELRNDREIIMAATDNVAFAHLFNGNAWPNSTIFYYASDQIRGDREFVLKIIKIDGKAFKYCSDVLKDDRHVALEAIKQYPKAIMYVSERLFFSREFVIEALSKNQMAISHIASTFQEDPEIVTTE
jgi:hypothetical protein